MNRSFMRSRIEELNLTTEALAGLTGVAPKYMEQILRGLTPSKRTLMLMSQALKCTIDELTHEGSGLPSRKAAAR